MERTPENGCRQLIQVCGDLKAHEKALIISDESTQAIGNILAHIALMTSPNVTHKIIPAADMHGKEPPDFIADMMKNADVIFGLTKMSMAHTYARYHANSAGARYLSLPDYSLELLTRPALFVDFRKLTTIAESIATRFTEGKKVRVTSELGTNLTLNISGRTGNAAPGWCFTKGTLASPPDAEANVAPIEEDTNGVMVVDGSIPCRELGILSQPITLHIQKGKIIAAEGKDSDILNNLFNKFNTDAVRVAAEFGIGLNPAAELIGSMLEDEGCLGTIHIGFGSNITIGGLNRVPFHLDTIVRNATVYIDDKILMEDGILEKFNESLNELVT